MPAGSESGDLWHEQYVAGEGFHFVDGGGEPPLDRFPLRLSADVGTPVSCEVW